MKYKKKPVVIEAVQYNNLNKREIEDFVGKSLKQQIEDGTDKETLVYSIIIPTLEGELKAMPGDFIIKGIKGEFYPCKPDVFRQTYDEV